MIRKLKYVYQRDNPLEIITDAPYRSDPALQGRSARSDDPLNYSDGCHRASSQRDARCWACLRDPHAGNLNRPSAGDHALGLRGREPGADRSTSISIVKARASMTASVQPSGMAGERRA
jgi:hypothetical protein